MFSIHCGPLSGDVMTGSVYEEDGWIVCAQTWHSASHVIELRGCLVAGSTCRFNNRAWFLSPVARPQRSLAHSMVDLNKHITCDDHMSNHKTSCLT